MAVEIFEEAGFSGLVLEPSSNEYAAALYRYSAIAERKARFIVYPKSADDVAIAVLAANKAKLQIAIKGGGNHASGASSCDDGLVIDLGHLKEISLNKTKQQVMVAGGCNWGEVYRYLKDHNLVCVGGGVHVVGVGGHLSGGGYGPLTQKHGMGCDNVVSAEVVLADGSIVVANEQNNSDLFWGIRGGSSQFGIITQFVLKTYPDPGSWFYRSVAFKAEALPDLIPPLTAFVDGSNKEEKVCLIFLVYVRGPPPHRAPVVVLNITALGEPEEFSSLFTNLFQSLAPLADHTTVCPSLIEVSHVMDNLLLSGPRRKATGAAPITELWPGLAEQLWQEWHDYTNTNTDSIDTKLVFEFHRTIRKKPELSCFPVTVPHNIVLISEEHSEEGHDSMSLDWIHKITQITREYQTKKCGVDLGVNANASMSNEKPEDVWMQNYSRLQRVKAKYDPTCVFDRFWHIDPQHD